MSLINWEELKQISMPPMPPRGRGKAPANTFDTDEASGMYNRVAKMEKTYTLNQLNAFDTSKKDTVLDIGCGPGRISVPMAQRARSVTSLDQSEKMLKYCRENAKEAGVKNLKTFQLDWNDAVLGKNVEQHDIVIASRSPGGQDLKKTCTFAKKYVVLIGWANGPNVPTVVGDLFIGVEGAPQFSPMRMDRRLSYNITYNMVYDMGYEPNVNVVLDGFTRDFASKDEAYLELWLLRTVPGSISPVFKKNVDKWLTKNNDGGVTFRRETRSYVIWFDPNPRVNF